MYQWKLEITTLFCSQVQNQKWKHKPHRWIQSAKKVAGALMCVKYIHGKEH